MTSSVTRNDRRSSAPPDGDVTAGTATPTNRNGVVTASAGDASGVDAGARVPSGSDSGDAQQQRFRERLMALLALIIVLGTMYMLIYALYVVEDEKAVQRAKDLVAYINPILGVVIGYYFGKVTAEARAEHAEEQAKTNAEVATASSKAAAAAQSGAKAAQSEAQSAQERLKRVREEARQLLAALDGDAGTSDPAGAAASMGSPELSGVRGPRPRARDVERASARLEAALDQTT